MESSSGGDVSPAELDAARLLLGRGIITEEDFAFALQELARTPGAGVLELLVARGVLPQPNRGPSAAPDSSPGPFAGTRVVRPWTVGKYTVTTHLGTGGMGVVYKAWDGELRRHCALKVVSDGTRSVPGVRSFGQEARRVLVREARTAARLIHPNIVLVYDVGVEGGLDFISMEYVPGLSLRDLLLVSRQHGPSEPKERGAWVRSLLLQMIEVVRAVDYAHRKGVIHRDLKPGNILATLETRPESTGPKRTLDVRSLKVADFGLSLDIAAESSSGFESDIVGTAAYVSPERARGRASGYFPAVDVYSLGVTLYEIIADKNPFLRSSIVETLSAVRGFDPPAPDTAAARLPRSVGEVVMRCIDKDPFMRYMTAEALADALEAALADSMQAGLDVRGDKRESSVIMQVIRGKTPTRRIVLGSRRRFGERSAIYYLRGRRRQQAGDLHGALRDFRSALKVASAGQEAVIRMRRGHVFYALGLFGDALEDWRWLTRQEPTAPEPFVNSALALRALSRYEEAVEFFVRALSVAGDEGSGRSAIERSIEKTKRMLLDSQAPTQRVR